MGDNEQALDESAITDDTPLTEVGLEEPTLPEVDTEDLLADETITLDEDDENGQMLSTVYFRDISRIGAATKQAIADFVSNDLAIGLSAIETYYRLRQQEQGTPDTNSPDDSTADEEIDTETVDGEIEGGEDGGVYDDGSTTGDSNTDDEYTTQTASDFGSPEDAAVLLDTLLIEYTTQVAAVMKVASIDYRGIVSDPEMLAAFRQNFAGIATADSAAAMFQIFAETGNRSAAIWLVLIGVEDLDNRLLDILVTTVPSTSSGDTEDGSTTGASAGEPCTAGGDDKPVSDIASAPLLRHHYDLYTEKAAAVSYSPLTPSANGILSRINKVDESMTSDILGTKLKFDAGSVSLGPQVSYTLFRVVHKLEMLDTSTGYYVPANPDLQWETYFVLTAMGLSAAVSLFGVSGPVELPEGVGVSTVGSSGLPGTTGNDRVLNSATGHSFSYLGPEFFTSGLNEVYMGVAASHTLLYETAGLESSYLSFYDSNNSRSLDIKQSASLGEQTSAFKVFQMAELGFTFQDGYSFATLNALVNNPLARIAIDSPFKASMTKDEIITREPADAQVAFRGVIGFLTDDSTLSDDDIMAISIAAKIVVDYDRYFFYRGRSVTYEVTVTGSYSIRGNRESNQVLALNRAVSVEEALTAALEVAAALTVTGKSAQDILYGGAISRAIIEEPAGASRGRTNNKALDRTATIDIVARDENGDILMPRDF